MSLVLASKFVDKDTLVLKYDKLQLEPYIGKIIKENNAKFEALALQKMDWDLYTILPLDFLQTFT